MKFNIYGKKYVWKNIRQSSKLSDISSYGTFLRYISINNTHPLYNSDIIVCALLNTSLCPQLYRDLFKHI